MSLDLFAVGFQTCNAVARSRLHKQGCSCFITVSITVLYMLLYCNVGLLFF